MAERRAAALRLLLIGLVISNVGAFAYILLAPDPASQASSRIEELQINPGRIKVLNAANRGPGGQPARAKSDRSAGSRACLEWGPFAASDTVKIETALGQLPLSEPAIQRAAGEASGEKRYTYFVREPDAQVVAQIAELQRGFPGTQIKAGPCPS